MESRPWKARFFTIWSGQQLSLVASSLAQFALVWWVTATTGSATVLATATMFALLPGVLLGPFAGALVDRWNRRRVIIVADGLVAIMAAWLAFLFWTDTIQIWHIYIIMFGRSIGDCFHWPAMTSSTSLMVPEKHLTRVSGINQTMQGARSIVAPPVGALLVALLPMHTILALDVVTALLAVVPLFFLPIPQPEPRTEPGAQKGGTSLLGDMREGFRYIWNWRGLRVLLFTSMILNFLLTPAGGLMPILTTRHFGGDAALLGWLNSVWGVGIVMGGLILGVWGGFRRRIFTALVVPSWDSPFSACSSRAS
jgi:DHA3 family macrolide efflux protein-like MFS transporter